MDISQLGVRGPGTSPVGTHRVDGVRNWQWKGMTICVYSLQGGFVDGR